ncbi:casein kinase substrate phosphoprotein PP28-domain-containing protein, partial [Dipodascopsis tothii]|uniref:casein kinase substrate phosphoprotein PP28-domain-containing protein n=1 Tax=Dipodascopsis tothii TaxID=44089 RepID=UPI0034CE290A
MPPRGKARKPVRGGGKHFSRSVRGFEGDSEHVAQEEEEEQLEPGERRPSVSSSEDEDDEEAKPAAPPVEVANPNRAPARPSADSAPQQLSRREREAMQAAAAKERYWKLHAEGKTDQAKADLARLALIRKEREEKAQQRKAEMEAKAELAAAKASDRLKAGR